MMEDVAVAIVVDELNPGVGVVRLAGNMTKRKPKAMFGGRVEFNLARNVFEACGIEQFLVLVQGIEGVEKDVIVAATTGCSLDQDATGIIGVDLHAAERSFN